MSCLPKLPPIGLGKQLTNRDAWAKGKSEARAMIYNLGSINADHAYDVPHLPQPGETLASSAYSLGLGGKGANMSVAIAQAGGSVRHIGAIGQDGAWAREKLLAFGVDCTHVVQVDVPTGHAIINVEPGGENAIVIYAGANQMQSAKVIRDAMRKAETGDTVLVQNETNGQVEALKIATGRGIRRVYAAAPFEAEAVKAALPLCDILVLNEVEMAQLHQASGQDVPELGVDTVVVTRGAKGVRCFERASDFRPLDIEAPKVVAVDTTGAGDTFTGYLVAGLDAGLALQDAVRRAVMAAALSVTKKGTTDAIPAVKDVLKAMA